MMQAQAVGGRRSQLLSFGDMLRFLYVFINGDKKKTKDNDVCEIRIKRTMLK